MPLDVTVTNLPTLVAISSDQQQSIVASRPTLVAISSDQQQLSVTSRPTLNIGVVPLIVYIDPMDPVDGVGGGGDIYEVELTDDVEAFLIG